MKFDAIITNPPYNKDLHLQILDELTKISDKVVCIHPGRWVEDILARYKGKGATGRKYEHLKKMLTKVMMIKQKDGCKMFNIGLPQDMMIGTYENGKDNNGILPIYNDSDMFFDVFGKIVKYANNVKNLGEYKIVGSGGKHKHRSNKNGVSDKNKIDGIRVIVKSITPGGEGQGNTEYGRTLDVLVIDKDIIINGFGVDGKVWFKTNGKIVNQWYKDKPDDTPIPYSIKFQTKELAQAFIDLYRTNVMKNIIHMLKYNQNAGHTHIPYFYPKVIKTEDDVLDALGITDENYRKWLKRDVYDYREKDFIKYGEWIDC